MIGPCRRARAAGAPAADTAARRRYGRHLKAFYIVHPTFWARCVVWFFTNFAVTNIKDRVWHIGSLQELFMRLGTDNIQLPAFVYKYDRAVNGAPAAVVPEPAGDAPADL